jgi:adenine-specific DNA-methyltransferase
VTDLEELKLEKFFDFPKPTSLLKEIIFGTTIFTKDSEEIILDFFSGS